ncbi:response regulator transcription factor [Brevundimonas halotolerans]|uniref:Two-component system KDP operon response regulator KdpE n=1 Tax=Brevundimonas halotolerans TaxID=69670 RepID=A0A7W9A2Z5_9CAUL|nr:response regulator transcription factor [Brevundimonas halotolerans]MBB5660507.1 two-component system KDP operon response regulator KdpE [Brevundimonas halotolerans]
MTKILLVEDEPHIVRALSPALEAEGYEITPVGNGSAAMEALAGEGFDLILLDLGLPDMDGKVVIERIREWSEVPIIVLSARHLEEEKIAAFDLGADDYVNKPFAMGELLARLRAAQRGRDRRFSSVSVFKAGGLTMDLSSRRVWIEDEPIHLTPKEYDLARTLARYAGRVVTHRQIAAAVWGGAGSVDSQSIRVLVAQLRQKIERNPARPRIVLTEQGLGYRMIEPLD